MGRLRRGEASRSQNRQARGASIVLFVFVCALLLIPVIGLAIDGAVLFWVKAKLSAAVDSAALAAGRNPSESASTAAQQYVYANYPPGWLGTSFSAAPAAVVTYPNQNTRTVTVTATVTVPLHFMTILGTKLSIVPAVAASSRRNSNVILVLDRSGSMNITGPDGNLVCNTMKASAETFVNYFADGQDQLGLVTFQTWANVDFALTTSFQSSSPNMNSYLSDLVCGQNTSSAMALNMAYQQIKSLGSSAYASNGALNVIVFFTDGDPNGITANYYPKDQTDARYYANPKYPPTPTDMTNQIDSSMPATTSQCQTSLKSAAPAIIVQGAGAESGYPSTGMTEGLFAVASPAPTSTCASGNNRAICNTSRPYISAPGCYSVASSAYTQAYPDYGQTAMREDVAYVPLANTYGNSTNNSSYMTQSSDWVQSGPYMNLGFRTDVPQTILDASFNAADAQALAIISDTIYKPVIYVIGLGGASDVTDENTFQTFLNRVANDPSSTRYNPNLPVGLFVYSPDDTQLAAAFHQIASQILRLTK